MRFVRLVLNLAIPDEGADVEQIKAALRQAWPAVDIIADDGKRVPQRFVHCRQCGRQFAAKRSDARYCSPACRMASLESRKPPGGKPAPNGDSGGDSEPSSRDVIE
jgi:hypothetical protein